MPRCDCCDLPVESCGKEAERRQRIERNSQLSELARKGFFPSQYGGNCFSCGLPFPKGTHIKAVMGGYKAECCA